MNDLIYRQDAIRTICESGVREERKGHLSMSMATAKQWAVGVIEQLPSAQTEVTPHRNYQFLSDYWCKCGWHLGKKGDVNYCANCGRKVKWDE